MADISKIVLPNSNEYNVKDMTARSGLASKQDALVSGTNIKTINNTSLLGSGNINISGGGSDVFIVEYGVTTYAEVLAAIENEQKIIIKKKESDGEAPDVLYYVNKYEIYNNKIDLDAIGYNSYIQVNIFSNGQWSYTNSGFKRNIDIVKLVINYEITDFYDIATKIQYFDEEGMDTISFIKDSSYGFGLILSYSHSSTSSQYKIEFIALLDSLSNTLPYKIKYTVIKNINTGDVTWSRSSTQLQSKLVSGTDIKTFNNQSLLGSGNISETDPVFVASVAYGISANDITNWNSKSDFSGSFIDLTNKPTTLSGYGITDAQETLVSGTNIKTINNTSILGSGNISVQEPLTSGTNIKTINNTSILGAGNISVLNADSTLSAAKLTGAITNGVTATTQSSGDNSTKIATTAYVDRAINDLPEPMVFQGSLGEGGTISTLPSASSLNKGYTYKVITDGTYASQAAKVGDTFISDGTAWVLVPSGDEPSGTVTSIATGSGLSGGPITTSGTISLATAFGDTVNPYGSKTANYVLAAPNGEAGVPTFRALVAADLPNGNWLNGSMTGSIRTIGSEQETSSYTIGQHAVAEGYQTQASGDYSHAQNYGAVAGYNYQTAIGKYNDNQSDNLFEIGNGTDPNNRSNAFTVDWDGNVDASGDITDGNGNVLSNMVAKSILLDFCHPVGTYYYTDDADFDPNDSWGGTWSLLGEGLVLMSGSASGTYEVGTRYGANYKKIENANIAHGHGFTQPKIPNHKHDIPGNWSSGSGSTTAYMTSANRSATTRTTSTDGGGGSCTGGAVSNLYGAESSRTNFNVMQASQAVYIWHRTA